MLNQNQNRVNKITGKIKQNQKQKQRERNIKIERFGGISEVSTSMYNLILPFAEQAASLQKESNR